ncbi:hypothetical protein K4L44_05910 [Halosquirtibacter laminarini]|uniref:Uncharacterized protein n=1 Tax=Halosquirtibacter laminarini TaxID=3374600 RepID=A0AC61NI54_9BACT|nr:hypothetical protein K4L44_05910 [Prolixibacteraceae bacterium]
MNKLSISQAEEKIRDTLFALKGGEIDVLTAYVKLNVYYDHINIHKVAMMDRGRVKHTNMNYPSHLRIKR